MPSYRIYSYPTPYTKLRSKISGINNYAKIATIPIQLYSSKIAGIFLAQIRIPNEIDLLK